MELADWRYILAWTGGYEPPSYKAVATEEEAWALANEWASEMDEGDTIDVLRIDVNDPLYIERLEAK